jgi:tetratricopeptide (TPR) repeat protein
MTVRIRCLAVVAALACVPCVPGLAAAGSGSGSAAAVGDRASQGLDKNAVLRVVQDEATRRQETLGRLKRTLARAEASRKAKNHWAATALYEATLSLSRELGGATVDDETGRAMEGLTTSRLALARTANKQREFADAERHITALLAIDPKNRKTLKRLEYTRAVAKAHEGKVPSPEVMALVQKREVERKDVSALVQDGKLLYEMRLLGEATAKLKRAIEIDSSNRPAYYYLSLIQEARYSNAARKRDLMQKERLVKVEREWNEFLK